MIKRQIACDLLRTKYHVHPERDRHCEVELHLQWMNMDSENVNRFQKGGELSQLITNPTIEKRIGNISTGNENLRFQFICIRLRTAHRF